MDEGLQMPNWYFELREAAAVVILSRTGIGLIGMIVKVLRIPAFLYVLYELRSSPATLSVF